MNDPPQALSAQQHYEIAKALHRQGMLAEAESHYRAVLQAEPGHFEAMEWLGALCAQTGRLEEAESHYRAILRAEPGHFDAMEWLGALCVQSKRFDEAINWLREAVARNSGSARLRSNLAGAFGAAERYEEAVEAYRHSLTIDPRGAVTYCDLGIMLSRLLRDEEAVAAFEKALTLKPDLVPAYEHLGYALSRLGRHDQGAYCFERVLAARPGQADAHLNYGVALAELGRHEEAAAQFRKVVAARPNDAHALHNLGSSLSALDDPTEALAAFERASAIIPDLPEVERGIGNALLQLGRLDEARAHFERAVALAPKVAAFHRAMADVKHFEEGDQQLVTLEKLTWNEASMAATERIELHFALAKAYDDLKRYASAFEHLQKGNAIKRGLVGYDEAKELTAMREMADAFAPELFKARRGAGDPSEVPVFIVGMPRSGTTLVEQILASHPNVFGAGERPEFGRVSGCGYGPRPIPFDPASLSGEDLRGMAGRYLERLLPRAPSAKRITDKLPANFRLVGLIRLALPNARIIHIGRDPADTCFSIYTKLFLDNIGFAYDLGELGRYYKAYDTLMAHWRAVLPEGAMLEVEYEALVGDFEQEARRIVAYCGLDWDGLCLEFHKNERTVRTASAVQVRQPIFRSSVGRWRLYKEHLQPLLDAIGAGSG
jgi:tetratricopeptide (TPR) repeat protein